MPMSKPSNPVSKYKGKLLSRDNVRSAWEISRCIINPIFFSLIVTYKKTNSDK